MKKSNKELEKEMIEEVYKCDEIVEDTDVGIVLKITADKDNPISDGKEFAGGDDDE